MDNILKLFHTTALTASGRPKMIADSEVELKYIENINIETVRKEKVFYNHSIILTNMRMLIVPTQQIITEEKNCRVLHLRFVTNFSDNAGMFKSSRRITANIIDGLQFHIRFNDRDKEVTLDLLGKSLHRKAWESVVDSARPTPVMSTKEEVSGAASGSSFSVLNAGVSGLRRRQEEVTRVISDSTCINLLPTHT